MRDTVFAAFQGGQNLGPGDSRQRMVRHGRRKLIETRLAGQTHCQLFSLADDPWRPATWPMTRPTPGVWPRCGACSTASERGRGIRLLTRTTRLSAIGNG